MVVNYSQFNITDDHGYNLYHAIRYCHAYKEYGLVFEKGVYDFFRDRATEDCFDLQVMNADKYYIEGNSLHFYDD